MPSELGEAILCRAEQDVPDITEHDKHLEGATFVTLDDALKLQAMVKDERGSTVTVVEGEGTEIQSEKNMHY